MMFLCLFVGSTFSSNVYSEQPDQRLLHLQKEGEPDIFKYYIYTLNVSDSVQDKNQV